MSGGKKETFALAPANAFNKEKKGKNFHAIALDIVAFKMSSLLGKKNGGGA